MEINYSALHDARELKQLLQSNLPIGKATVKDTQEFLRQPGLTCSEEIKEGHKAFNALLKLYGSKTQFDSILGCQIPIKSTGEFTWNPVALLRSFLKSHLVTWCFMVRFYFVRGVLVEIDTEKVGTGL